MNFYSFLVGIFSFFHTIVVYALKPVFNLLITNNIIKLSLCIGLLIFIIEYHFEIIHLLPRILGLANEQEKEFDTKSVSVRTSENLNGTVITRTHNRIRRKRVK